MVVAGEYQNGVADILALLAGDTADVQRLSCQAGVAAPPAIFPAAMPGYPAATAPQPDRPRRVCHEAPFVCCLVARIRYGTLNGPGCRAFRREDGTERPSQTGSRHTERMFESACHAERVAASGMTPGRTGLTLAERTDLLSALVRAMPGSGVRGGPE